MTFFPSTLAAQLRRRSTAGAALGLLGVLLLTGCEASPAEQAGTPAADPGTSTGGVQQQVPEPAGNQLSHEEMREQLGSRYPDAALSDTTDYWAGLRDIETELQRLVVDPPECKQFVVRSAVPVPAGALVAYADETAEPTQDESAEQDDGAEESEGDVEPEGDAEPEGDPEAGAFDAGVRIQLAGTEEDSGSEENAGSEGDGDESADSESGENAGSEGDGTSADEGDSGDSEEEEPEPVTVELPAQRQAVIYSFRDWRAADAHLAAEKDGLESCDSYTATRGEEDSAETSTSVDSVDVSTSVDDAVGTTRRISSEDDREHSAAVTLRDGSHIVTVSVPLEDALSEEEAEVAVEELQIEAVELIESLD